MTYDVIPNQSKNICLVRLNIFDCKDGGQQDHPGSFHQMQPRGSTMFVSSSHSCVPFDLCTMVLFLLLHQ